MIPKISNADSRRIFFLVEKYFPYYGEMGKTMLVGLIESMLQSEFSTRANVIRDGTRYSELLIEAHMIITVFQKEQAEIAVINLTKSNISDNVIIR
ncbi:MAG: hypothetical protein WCJ58_02730 [bacterium]